MRRRVTLAVLGTLLLAAAGCSGDETTGGPQPVTGVSSAAVPAPSGGSGAPPAGPALSPPNQQICDQAALAGTDFGESYLTDLQLQIDAAGKGAAANTQAQQKITRDVQSYSSVLAGFAHAATDPVLKKTLTRMGKEVSALKGEVAKVDAERLSALADTLDEACGWS
ncbi:MAG TPA: hypothetical protein VGB74_08175 [Actinoplanes sp.]|jgi:hypothetical protein